MSATTQITNAYLKEVLTDTLLGRQVSIKDVDEIRQTGIYALQNGMSNCPPDVTIGSILIVLRWDANRQYQVIIIPGKIYWRSNYSGAWQSWRKVTDTIVT